ncbi:MAG: PPOX class F420-dependent oxidoreductase [Actinomycetota bacterium]|nr:PPOX class F420-dependent oxidoreductase [Actinomycetota bacterium]MDQ5808138.1 PPOX class F420-dependent oxidoreductase [Actinomycetota bacterium]
MATIEGRVKELLEQPNFTHLSTLREDGSIHGVVVWQHVEDGKVALNSSEGRAWPANVRRNPQVTITVHSEENPYEYVEIRGRVVEDTHDGAKEHIDALAKKYMDKDEYPFLQPGEQRIKFLVEPERIRHADPR